MIEKYDLEITIRDPEPNDKQYLFHSWLTSLRFNKPFDALEKCWYNVATSALISRLLVSSNMLVAVNPSNESQIFGYVVFNNNSRTLHFIYIKKSFRMARVATRLMEAAFGSFDEPISYTVRTTAIPHYEKKWNLIFRPYMLSDNAKERR